LADLVSNALAINDQQTQTQNRGVYQKRIQNTQVASPSSSGSDLASALGILGGTVAQSFSDQEKRNEKLGIDAAEKIVAGRTDAEMHKLSAIEMLGNYTTDKELQDNPYAIATIEKMRGSYLASQGHDEYSEWRAQQPPVKTASEEISRYDDFMEKKRVAVLGTAINQEAFNRGYNDKKIPNQLAVAGQQRSEQALELRAIQKGSIQAAIGQLVQRSDQTSDEDFSKNLNEIFADARISWMPIQERVQFAQETLKQLATTTGDFGRIEKISKDVTIGTDSSGNSIKLGDVTDTTSYKQVAEQRTSQIYGENVQKSLKELQGMSVADQNAYYANLQVTNPSWYNVMTPYRDNMVKYRETLDHKQAILEAKARAANSVKTMASAALDSNLEAWMHDSLHDGAGRVVASSKGALPDIEADDIDDKGNPVKKKFVWSDDVLNAKVDEGLRNIQNRTDLTDEQKTQQVMKLLQYPPFESYRTTVKNAFVSSLDNASVGQLKTSPEGWVGAPPQLLQTLAMARVNPEQFRAIFGEDASNKAGAIQQLSEGTNGDYAQGLAMYALGKENMKNKEFVHTQNLAIKDSLTYSNMSGFTDLEGNEVSADMALGTNDGAMAVIEKQAQMMSYANKTPVDAVNAAKANAVKTYKVYEHALVPEGLFGGINSAQRLAVGKTTLDDFKGMFISSSGVDPAFVSVQYMPESQSVVFSGGGQYKSYNANDIAYYGNKLLEQAPRHSTNNADFNQILQDRVDYTKTNEMTLDSTGVVGS
jgi:hypothetical protein